MYFTYDILKTLNSHNMEVFYSESTNVFEHYSTTYCTVSLLKKY